MDFFEKFFNLILEAFENDIVQIGCQSYVLKDC